MFTVVAKPNQQDVLDALDDLEGTITGLMTTSEGKIIAAINTKTGTIMTELSALSPKLQGIEDTVIIIATMLGEVQVDIAALDMSALNTLGVDITAIKGDVATIKTNIGTVNTKVSNLDPVIGAIAGQNAEIQTKLGTLEGTITSIEGNTATIETKVGTLQADLTSDIADIPGKVDMMPVWIAVVLSLIAAIAAIFAVITIRQKIAG
jgi:chromosome segregation ATPase